MMAVDAERRPAAATVLSLQPPSPICHPDRRGGTCGSLHQQPIPAGSATLPIVILRTSDLFDLPRFCTPQPRCFSTPSAKPSSCLPRLAVGAKRLADLSYNEGFSGAKSKDPGDDHWQILLGAFRPQTTRKIKKSQPHRSEAEGEGSAVLPTLPGKPSYRSSSQPGNMTQ